MGRRDVLKYLAPAWLAFLEGFRDGLRAFHRIVTAPWRAVKVAAAAFYGFTERMHQLEQASCRHYHLQMKDAKTVSRSFECQYLRVWLECIDCGEWWFVQGRAQAPVPLLTGMRDANLHPSSEAIKILRDNGIDPREYYLR